MPARSVRKIQALILGTTGLFLLQKIWSGTLFFYINERFVVLILLAALGLLAFTQAVISDLLPQKRPNRLLSTGQDDPGDGHLRPADEDLPSPLPNQTPKRFPWAVLIVALPVLLGILIPTRPLGASVVANKGLRVTSPIRSTEASQRLLLEIPPANRTILDWLQLFGSEQDPARFVGQPVDLIGFVYQDPRLPEGQFMISRFTLSCCVADAFAIGMIVESPDGSLYPENSWVRVQGSLDSGNIENQVIPRILAEKVQAISEPAQPYLIGR